MQYNRHCDVFLVLLLLLFIPPSEPKSRYLVVDGIIYGPLAALLFYSKVTFGVAALGLGPLLLIHKRDNVIVVLVAAIVFVAIAGWIEYVYGIHFSWFGDLKMGAEFFSSKNSQASFLG